MNEITAENASEAAFTARAFASTVINTREMRKTSNSAPRTAPRSSE